jgi:hypothetical protein
MYSRLRKSENLQKKQSLNSHNFGADAPLSKNGHRPSSDTIRQPSSVYLFSSGAPTFSPPPLDKIFVFILIKKLPDVGSLA